MFLLTPIVSNFLRIVFYVLVIITSVLGILAVVENNKSKKINEVSLSNGVTNTVMQKRNLAIYKFNILLFFTMSVMFVRQNIGTLVHGLRVSYYTIPNFAFIAAIVVIFFIALKCVNKGKIFQGSMVLFASSMLFEALYYFLYYNPIF